MKKLILMLTAFFALTAHAQFNPTKEPIKAVIPFAPGGGTDLVFRHFQKYSEQQGISVVPVYKPGADGLIGIQEVINTNDSHTIAFATVAVHANYLQKNPDYKFEYVSMVRESVMVFVTQSSSKLNNLDDLENAIKENKVKFAYGAPAQKMIIEQLLTFVKPTETPILVPYKGAGPAIQDILGGHVDIAVVPMIVVKSQLESGKLKALAIVAKRPWQEISHIQSVNKKYKAWENNDGFLISLPKTASKETVEFWRQYVRKYVQDPSFVKEFHNDFTEPAEFGPDVANKMVESSLRKMK